MSDEERPRVPQVTRRDTVATAEKHHAPSVKPLRGQGGELMDNTEGLSKGTPHVYCTLR